MIWPVTTGVSLLALFVVVGLSVRGVPAEVDTATFSALWLGVPLVTGGFVEPLSDILGLWTAGALAVGMIVGAVLAWRRGDRDTVGTIVRVGVVYALCRFTSFVTKPLFDRDRPRPDYPELSYPSGHVVAAASMAFAAILLCLHLAARRTTLVATVVVLLTVATAACRVALGVHWLSDTLGSVLAVGGVGLLTATALRLLPVAGDTRPGARAEA